MHVAVIGSGIAGLATAIRLAVKGQKVTVYEANDYPGGKLSQITKNGYRFDAGPSLFTLPTLVEELFTIADERAEDHFEYERLDINCHYFYPDGTELTAFADADAFVQELSHKLGEDAGRIRQAMSQSQLLYDRLSKVFMYSSLQDIKTFLSKDAFKAYTSIPSLGFASTMHGANSKLFKDARTVQFFDRYATYNGSSPYKTPATMNIIPHLEMSLGAYFPKGGMHAITLALFELAKRQGVEFQFGQPVRRINIAEGKVSGVQLTSGDRDYERVVSNMDVVNTYRKLLPDTKPPSFLLNQPKSSSALIFYWGIRDSFPKLGLHNIFFSGDYMGEFECIFEKGTIHPDPTVYVNISCKLQSLDAPEGCENWFTMINVPNNQGQDWDRLIAEARDNILRKLTQMLGTEIEKLIEVEEILDPRSIETKTSSALGALYGNSSNNLFAAFLRHANVSKRINGLYFCGGSVHPGGGIPMCLLSARLVGEHFR